MRLDPELEQALRDRADADDTNASEVIREALRAWLRTAQLTNDLTNPLPPLVHRVGNSADPGSTPGRILSTSDHAERLKVWRGCHTGG